MHDVYQTEQFFSCQTSHQAGTTILSVVPSFAGGTDLLGLNTSKPPKMGNIVSLEKPLR